MKYIPSFLALSFFLFASPFYKLNAQSTAPDVIASAGNFAAFTNGSMTWTVGETMIETYSPNPYSFTQGFNQPLPSIPISVPVLKKNAWSVFPNPVSDQLTIDLTDAKGNYLLTLQDIQGRILQTSNVMVYQSTVQIPFHSFANGIYLLSILNTETHVLNSYKISKTE
ncbi:MAG TPA: T9SS type A sorting domain-containing protein [Bacteroidia bacterium]|nr:T9SS type A sorting domain-containing protein [Bacteroidia bacterium]